VSRGLSLGVILYASALVLAEALGMTIVTALVLIGAFSVAYTSLGGIVADIWSDVVQLVLLWLGTAAAAGFLLWRGGFGLLLAAPPERATALVTTSWGAGGDTPFALWPMLFGGFFLYMSYYGCDQSQSQRLLTARDDGQARRALLLNGLLRFPLVVTYCGFGLLLAGLLQTAAGFAARMAGRPADSLVPTFMMEFLPVGLRGLMMAAIMAAAMSSIDSALNSLAAVTLEDVLERPAKQQGVWLSRMVSLGWGVFAVASGLAFARSQAGVIETINQVGSAFYGPVLAVFLLGVLVPSVTQGGALAGFVAGLLGNGALAVWAPGLSWLWWNPAGFAVAIVVALAAARAWPEWKAVEWPRREATWLLGGFVIMLMTLLTLPRG
jgi:SSS family solute:Na+ symporter